jgi:glycosyltransferase involved in cell wall biosynthesis
MGAARVTTIHNGIDPETFRRRSSPAVARGLLGLPNDGRPVVGSTGRLDEAKGYSFLLDAVARLRGRGHDLVVAIAGDGPDRKHLEYLAAQLGIADAVRFLGFQRDVQPVLDALDLFVLPSLTETLGYSLLEAMATELPTIGSRVGGIPEVIVPGQTGLLVPPRDPDALTAAIEQLIRSPALCRRMGSAGRERVVRHFHERDMVRKTIECYRAVLPRTRRRPCSNQANGDDRDNRSRHHQMA